MARNPTENFRKLAGKSPEEATFFWTGGPVELADKTWFQSFQSGCTAFETDEGLVLVDTGLVRRADNLASALRQETKSPVHTAVYTHGHIDHAYGLAKFLVEGQNTPRIIGQRAMPERFTRYGKTLIHNQSINARQLGGTVSAPVFNIEPGASAFIMPEYPPNLLYDDRMTLTVGGLTFELHHCRGETDDHTWVFCREREVLCPGDLFIWGVPNAGNPQKAQRYPWDWANGLRQMAAYKPRSMGPGHGGPVVNQPDLLQTMLLETADYLDSLVSQTLSELENGSPPHVDIVRSVTPPSSDSPWLQPVYDEAEFIIRNVIRYYGGWWSGRPSELKPAPRSDVAKEIADAAGGARALAARAKKLGETGDLRLACHLADYAIESAPEDAEVQKIVGDLYDLRAEAESSLMATNLFRSSAAYAREARSFA